MYVPHLTTESLHLHLHSTREPEIEDDENKAKERQRRAEAIAVDTAVLLQEAQIPPVWAILYP